MRLVQSGRIAEAALDAAVGRILLHKFQQGLFENPYVDVAAAADILGRASSKQLALEAQRRSVVLVRNGAATLPLSVERTPRLYLHQIDADADSPTGLCRGRTSRGCRPGIGRGDHAP